jgi:hypothetical protein
MVRKPWQVIIGLNLVRRRISPNNIKKQRRIRQ